LIIDRLKVSGTLRDIIENTGWLFGLRILRMLFALFVMAWVARYLGTGQFGILQYSIAFALSLIHISEPTRRRGISYGISSTNRNRRTRSSALRSFSG